MIEKIHQKRRWDKHPATERPPPHHNQRPRAYNTGMNTAVSTLLITWLSSALALWLTALVLPGFDVKNGFKGAAWVAVILGLLQAVFGWLIYGVLIVGTLGLGLLFKSITQLVVTTLLLVITDKVSDTLKIQSFWTAALGALLTTVGTVLLSSIIRGLVS